MSSAGKNIMGTVFFQVPTLILGIIGGIFLTRLLGPEGKGV
jgi:O-antigen/teichoic acid export membrane protein